MSTDARAGQGGVPGGVVLDARERDDRRRSRQMRCSSSLSSESDSRMSSAGGESGGVVGGVRVGVRGGEREVGLRGLSDVRLVGEGVREPLTEKSLVAREGVANFLAGIAGADLGEGLGLVGVAVGVAAACFGGVVCAAGVFGEAGAGSSARE